MLSPSRPSLRKIESCYHQSDLFGNTRPRNILKDYGFQQQQNDTVCDAPTRVRAIENLICISGSFYNVCFNII